MYRIPATSLDALLAAIAEQAKLYLPVDNGDQANYTEWSEGVKFSNRLNTLRSAKDFFFPQTQNLMDFKINGKFIEVIDNRKESEDFVLFGVRACDAASFDILDKVFLAEPVDTYYKTRREHSIIMTLACNKPEETCFSRHLVLMSLIRAAILVAGWQTISFTWIPRQRKEVRL